MEKLINFLSQMNIQTLLGTFLMLWYFTRHIEGKMEKQAQQTDRLYEMFIELLKEQKNG